MLLMPRKPSRIQRAGRHERPYHTKPVNCVKLIPPDFVTAKPLADYCAGHATAWTRRFEIVQPTLHLPWTVLKLNRESRALRVPGWYSFRCCIRIHVYPVSSEDFKRFGIVVAVGVESPVR